MLSQDQDLLYVGGLQGILVTNTNTLRGEGEYLKQQDFTGLAMSGDGHMLYGIDPSNGETLTVITGVVQAPWGIKLATEQAVS